MANEDLGKQRTCQRGTPSEFKKHMDEYDNGLKSRYKGCSC